MPFKKSGNLLLAHPEAQEAAWFYRDVLGSVTAFGPHQWIKELKRPMRPW
jgi:hypothetical protein